MKNRKYGIVFGIALACALLLISCDNLHNKTADSDTPIENGYGRISVSFAGWAARTAYPEPVFDNYVYTFIKDDIPEVKTPESDGSFILEVGTYTLEVEAYMGAVEADNPAASGTSDPFIVSSGSNTDVEIILTEESGGTGKFSYAITYPLGATAAITLEKLSDNTPVALIPTTTDDGTVETQSKTLMPLDAGIYLLTVNITKGDQYAGTVKAVHIKPFLTTEYEKEFKDTDLIDATFYVASTAAWDAARTAIANGGGGKKYVIKIDGNFNVTAEQDPGPGTFGNNTTGLKITIIINGNGNTLTLSGNGYILRPAADQEITINDLNLEGHGSNTWGLVYMMNGGSLTMAGNSSLSGNTAAATGGFGGGAVALGGGATFTMNGGTIKGNTINSTTTGNGGGVTVTGGSTFIMNGGTIEGNTAELSGGGVYVNGGTFKMSGGTIYGSGAGTGLANTANSGASLFVNSGTAEYSGSYAGNGYGTGTDGDTIDTTNKTLPPVIITGQADLAKIGTDPDFPLDRHYILTSNITISGTWMPIGPGTSSTDRFTGTFDGNGHTIDMGTQNSNLNKYGLFGHIGTGGTVKNLKLEGSISTTTSGEFFAGAVAGYNQGTIQNVASSVNVSATANGTSSPAHSGGIVGANDGNIQNCYSTGNIYVKESGASNAEAGGIAGVATGTVDSCWASGDIRTESTTNSNYQFAGGIIGNGNGSIESCVALNYTIQTNALNTGGNRIIGYDDGGAASLTNNHANSSMGLYYNGGTYPTAGGTDSNVNGADFTYPSSQGDWTSATGWTVNGTQIAADETSPWYWDDIGGVPRLWFDDKGPLPIYLITPTAADFNITGAGNVTWDGSTGTWTVTFDGNAKTLAVAAKTGITGMGTVTVYYEGISGTSYGSSSTGPTNAGTYAVIFDVAQGTGYKSATGLSAGTLTINHPVTPTEANFDITGAGTYVHDGTTRTVSVTSKPGITGMGTITVSYTDKITNNISTTAPSAVGTYIVTIDVTAGGNYTAATGLSAGTLIIGNSISNQTELQGINLTGTYVLVGDITVSGNWTPLGDDTNKFMGTLDGGGHTITLNNPTMQPDTSVIINCGLFATIGTSGEVKNLKLTGTVSYTGGATHWTYFGPLVGHNRGTIRNVASSVNVTVTDTTDRVWGGGIVGMMNYGLIENCYSTGNISVTASALSIPGISGQIAAYAGGIVGENYPDIGSGTGSIKNCWASGTISAVVTNDANCRAAAGGIAGDGKATDCVALNSTITATAPSGVYAGRVSGRTNGTSNYAASAMLVNGSAASGGTTANKDGADASPTTQNWWTGTADWAINSVGGSESSPWLWGSVNSQPRPILWFE